MSSTVEQAELLSSNIPGPVPYAVITPSGAGPFPLVLVLMGGGGSRQSLIDCQPLFDRWWAEGSVAPMVLATPSAGMSYYVEDPADGVRWECFLVDEFVPHLRAVCKVNSSTAITGISMGGYGALKTAFAHPEKFEAVAAMNPMIEPGFEDAEIPARNRLHHSSGGPERLIGPGRDRALFAENHPANRARLHAARIHESGLPIYIEAGDNDFVNAHDGAEFLHRVLWGLDISHEYHLVRGADHGGGTFRPRMLETFAWVERALASPGSEDQSMSAIRAQIQPLRDRAAATDPTAHRRFGVLR
jgi:S-formylglutathione hydrolase